MSITVNINGKPDIYYFNENNDVTNIDHAIKSYDDMILVINKIYNNDEELIILCNLSMRLARDCLNSNSRFNYNYYVAVLKQYFKYEFISTITWGSFYTLPHAVPNNITYKILKMFFDYDNSGTVKLLNIVDSTMVEFNDDDLIDMNKRIMIKKF